MFSSAVELARFTMAFMNDGIIDGHPVLKPSAIATLSTGYADVPSNGLSPGSLQLANTP